MENVFGCWVLVSVNLVMCDHIDREVFHVAVEVKMGQTSGSFPILWREIPTSSLSSAEKTFQLPLQMHLLFSLSLSEFSNSAVTFHLAVFHCQFQL